MRDAMNKLGKRALSLLMSVIMLLSLLPASALAAETMPECGKEEHVHTDSAIGTSAF